MLGSSHHWWCIIVGPRMGSLGGWRLPLLLLRPCCMQHPLEAMGANVVKLLLRCTETTTFSGDRRGKEGGEQLPDVGHVQVPVVDHLLKRASLLLRFDDNIFLLEEESVVINSLDMLRSTDNWFWYLDSAMKVCLRSGGTSTVLGTKITVGMLFMIFILFVCWISTTALLDERLKKERSGCLWEFYEHKWWQRGTAQQLVERAS